ncbi:MAG: short-chain dehydrogenase [Bacteroidetes bacterium HGW-Bacteroidetes-21]|jgi:enoyl-[acyl-carrier protein] reductase I|nr:MAG: short-chain dehydrogenase [Bacteroidetes bacterium HGW-Bacteroidetes-21]
MKPLAVILGGSGGMGLACANTLSQKGYDIIIVHRDRKSQMPEVEQAFAKIRTTGQTLTTFNANVNSTETLESVNHFVIASGQKVQVLIHAIADGNIGSLFEKEGGLNLESLTHTFTSMAATFVQWTQLFFQHNLFAAGGRVIGLTSEGSYKYLTGYAAVGMAKASLESACRYMAIELAPQNITVNLINAGITNTKALAVFPEYEKLIQDAKKRNPHQRLTTPEDIAKVVSFLASDDSAWITGETIRVDGGEQLKSF